MKKLYRSNEDSLIAGICGGLADYYKVDATVIRMGVVIGALFFLPIAIAYAIGIFIIPEIEAAISSPRIPHSKQDKSEDTLSEDGTPIEEIPDKIDGLHEE